MTLQNAIVNAIALGISYGEHSRCWPGPLIPGVAQHQLVLLMVAMTRGYTGCCCSLARHLGIHDARACVVDLPGLLADATRCSAGALPCFAWHYHLRMLHTCLQALMPLTWLTPSTRRLLLGRKVGEPSARDFAWYCPVRRLERTSPLTTGQAVAIAISEAIVNTTNGTAGAVCEGVPDLSLPYVHSVAGTSLQRVPATEWT